MFLVQLCADFCHNGAMGEKPKLLDVFFEVQRGLPRQGPGSEQSTLAAYRLCFNVPDDANVLDIGCGPGMQTITLAEACPGTIIAVDTCDEYLDELRLRLRNSKLADRVEVSNADMGKLPFSGQSFDLIWSEGAAYIVGIAAALKTWRPLLRGNGYLAFTELVWLEQQPPSTVVEFWHSEYPAMMSVGAVKELISETGYELVGDFTLPDSDWWENYYTPLEAKLPSLQKKYAGDEEALGVIAMTEAEIAMRRQYSNSYGYQFFVVRSQG